jgi:hypothetical protein
MRTHLTAITLAAVVAGLAAGPAHAQIERTARFYVHAEGVQTTKWTQKSGTFTDCNGAHTTDGEGTEVVRFDSGKPQKLVIQRLGSVIRATYGTWDPLELEIEPHILAVTRITRQGRIVQKVSGGWCGEGSEKDTGPYDCGRRRAHAGLVLSWRNLREVEVSHVNLAQPAAYRNCPIAIPNEVRAMGVTKTIGRLSAKLLFGKRDRIVLEDGDQYKRDEEFVDSFSTTHVRITLTRAR